MNFTQCFCFVCSWNASTTSCCRSWRRRWNWTRDTWLWVRTSSHSLQMTRHTLSTLTLWTEAPINKTTLYFSVSLRIHQIMKVIWIVNGVLGPVRCFKQYAILLLSLDFAVVSLMLHMAPSYLFWHILPFNVFVSLGLVRFCCCCFGNTLFWQSLLNILLAKSNF